jgi:hypothetical protein
MPDKVIPHHLRSAMPNAVATTNAAVVRLPDGQIGLGFESSGGLATLLRSLAASLGQKEVPAYAQDLLPEILRHAIMLHIPRVEIADGCQVSEATLSRWASGTTRPHIVLAQTAVQVIAALALKRASELDQLNSKKAQAKSI